MSIMLTKEILQLPVFTTVSSKEKYNNKEKNRPTQIQDIVNEGKSSVA